MPLTKSALKALKTDKRRKTENDATRAKVKSALKGAKIAIRNEKKGEEIQELVSKAYAELDKAAKKNVIHKNKAARIKSRIMKKLASSEKPAEKAAKKAPKETKKKVK